MLSQQARYPKPPTLARPASVLLEPSTAPHLLSQNKHSNRPRSQSQVVYPSYLPPPSVSSSSSTSSLISTTVSSSCTGNSVNTGTGFEAPSDNPVRWRQPPHKSKLSKQYTPSEEESDEEPGTKTDFKRRSKFMSGTALELNSEGTDSLRAFSQMTLSQTPPRSETPSLSESADSGSVKSTKKKISLGKRISRFFSGGNKSSDSISSLGSPKSSASSIAGSEKSGQVRTSTTSLISVDGLVTPPSLAHAVYMHQRSISTPDHIGNTLNYANSSGTSPTLVYNTKMEESRLRSARDSGFGETDSNGHRRRSSSFAGPGTPTSRSSSPKMQHLPHPQGITSSSISVSSINSSRSSAHKSADHVQIDSHPQHQQQAQQARQSTFGGNAPLSTSSPQLRANSDRELQLPMNSQHHSHRYSAMGAELASSPSSLSFTRPTSPSMPRRSSAPIPVSETLISKVTREKGSVCFQAPNVKKETFTKDANLDPVLSNMVQQHRRDFKMNQRLSLNPQSHVGGISSSPRMRMTMYMEDHNMPPMVLARDPNARQDSTGSQHLYYTNGLGSPQFASAAYSPGSPGLHTSETPSKRLSTGSQHQQQQQHPYFSTGQRINFSGSQGSLNQHSVSTQSGQNSPRHAGPSSSSPKRLSSTSHSSFQQQQQFYQLDSPTRPQFLNESPFSSPRLTATGLFAASPTTSTPTEMSVQQQQQQLEQLQQIRIQNQHILIQQQQQLQQQLEQTHATAVAMQQVGLGLGVIPGSVSAPRPVSVHMPLANSVSPKNTSKAVALGSSKYASRQQQQQQQQQPKYVHY
ncbi:hypothetical protein BGZ99_007302 [Dissophora globulifera]|uniref:Uncharacterized protein n=1 Tax=Dissophora globulifera TaxID=979702 RepID=A0A9P6RSP2_9FUNG|nr:hypothetical protein BGZ99_007302 [Dissophora globulifera]